MINDSRRITLISREPTSPGRGWNRSPEAATRIITSESAAVLLFALSGGLFGGERDVERVIFDRTVSAFDYLQFLASLPPGYNGDVLYIRPDQSGFLSAKGRGDGRSLHQLTEHDVRFYLEINDLVTDRRISGLSVVSPTSSGRAEVA